LVIFGRTKPFTNKSIEMFMKIAKFFALGILTIITIIIVLIFIQTHDRHSGYKLDLRLPAEGKKQGKIKVGFANSNITPDLPDRWTDIDNNAQYEPYKGDTYTDGNANGKFDTYWLAGFDNKRAANGVHDDIWARAIVWDDSASVVGMVVLDAIGFLNDDVITVREMVKKRIPSIDHLIISSTHCHEVPDLMGMWGESQFKTGVNPKYRRLVQERAAEAVYKAYKSRKTASIEFAQVDSVPKDLVADTRMPIVYDDGIRIMKVTGIDDGKLLGLLVNYGCHPETAGSKNLLITSDYVHYLREGIEKGIFYDGIKKRDGIGGTVVFANGAVGGLMTGMSAATYDPWLNKTFPRDENSFEKARAQGYRLANIILDKLENGNTIKVENTTIQLNAKTFWLKLSNPLFRLGAYVGVFRRSIKRFSYIRSEVDLLSIGPAWILTVPGEIYPEIVNGGIESPSGGDFKIDPVEVPPFRQLMKGEINFVIGLANDEVGYIIPKSEWDEKPPFAYGKKEAPYGEINSLGPETGPEIHRQVLEVIENKLKNSK
jgi:hypothetical protein